MKFGLDLPINGAYADPRLLADLAADAEHAGWDGFFVQDVFVGADAILDPWITLAAIAMQTRHLRLGVFLTPLPRRRPWKVARETVTLDHLSHGRLIFGAGLGFQASDFTVFGEESGARVRAEKLDEGLQILSGLWTGRPFSFHGAHYQVEDVTFLPRPVQVPRIPIWVAGGWPHRKPFHRAAQWDGIYLMTYNQVTQAYLTPAEIREIAAYLHRYRTELTPLDIAVNGEAPADAQQAASLIQQYEAAGATWWIELDHGSVAEYRERIRRGPPRW